MDLRSGRIKYQLRLIKGRTFYAYKKHPLRIFERNSMLVPLPGRQQMFQMFTLFDPIITCLEICPMETV